MLVFRMAVGMFEHEQQTPFPLTNCLLQPLAACASDIGRYARLGAVGKRDS